MKPRKSLPPKKLNYHAFQPPEQFRVEPEENAQHAGQVHLGYVLLGQRAEELI